MGCLHCKGQFVCRGISVNFVGIQMLDCTCIHPHTWGDLLPNQGPRRSGRRRPPSPRKTNGAKGISFMLCRPSAVQQATFSSPAQPFVPCSDWSAGLGPARKSTDQLPGLLKTSNQLLATKREQFHYSDHCRCMQKVQDLKTAAATNKTGSVLTS